MFASTDYGTTHRIVLRAFPDEIAAEALARRAGIAPELPAGARLIFEASKPYPKANEWSLSSVVVATEPLLRATDIATCQLVELPNVTIDLGGGLGDHSEMWPYLRITWSAESQAKLRALVATTPKAQLYAAFGDDVVDDWVPGVPREGAIESVDLRVPAPDSTIARRRLRRMILPCL